MRVSSYKGLIMNSSNIIAAAVLGVGLTVAAWTLGNQFDKLHETGVITVKGLAEAHYQASTGTWRVGVDVWGEDYAQALQNNEKQLKVIKKFLKEHGFADDAIKIGEIDVSRHYETYVDEKGEEHQKHKGYDATRYYQVTTSELPKLQKAVQAVQQLRANYEDVVFQSPQYYLADLENIKRTLISKATQDAHVRAEEFAKTGNIKVGAMKSASQGSFDIQSANPSSDADSDDYGGSYDTTTIDKNVRLVVTIQYQIEK